MSSNTAQLTGYSPEPQKSNDYSDIINLARPSSLRHPHMSLANRAAQFAPFSALTGYQDLVDQVEQQTYFTGQTIIPDPNYTEFDATPQVSPDDIYLDLINQSTNVNIDLQN